MKKLFFLFSLLVAYSSYAQDVINREFTAIKPTDAFSFQPIANNSKIFGMSSNGTYIIYDKMWKELEKHEPGQDEIFSGSNSATRSADYDSSKHTYSTTDWDNTDYEYTRPKYSYNISFFNNYSDFFQGNANKLNLIRSVSESFLNSHRASTFSETYTGIAGQLSYVYNGYTALITHFEIVDWDGNMSTIIEPPYYIGSGSCQTLEVGDKAYLIVSAYSIYPKNIIKDCNLYSKEEYELSSKQIEPDKYHYYIYEYDKPTSSVNLVKSESVKANRHLVGIYDLKGNRLEKEQSGVNILLYSDGTSTKILNQ